MAKGQSGMNEASFKALQNAASLKNEREIAWAASAIPCDDHSAKL